MNLLLAEASHWVRVATVEVADSAPDFAELVRNDTLQFQARSADKSPTGYLWYDIYVDQRSGDRRAARTAWAILSALKSADERGFLEGYRIINGDHWLTLGDSDADMRLDDMMPGDLVPS